MTNVSKYQMGLKLISISMLHLTSNIKSSRQLLKETRTILVLTDSIESNIMDNLDMFQSIFGKIDKFGWWGLERISSDAGTQFTSKEFKE